MDENGTVRSIIHLADYGGAYSGNFVASLLALDLKLRSLGLRQVVVFSDIAKGRGWLEGVSARGIPLYFLSRGASPLLLGREIAKIAEAENAVILHTHFTTFDVPACIGAFLGQSRGGRPAVVWHIHSYLPIKQTIARKMKDLLKFRILGRSVTAVTLYQGMSDAMVMRGFRGTSQVIFNGVDLDRARSLRRGREEIRSELGANNGEVVMLSLGWDPYRKGIDLLLDAALTINVNQPFILLLVGESTLREYINARIGKKWPVWLRFSDPVEHIGDLLHASDIFVSASRWEGFPYSVAEAMAIGLPIISSDIPSLKWAHETRGVCFFNAEDTSGLRLALEQMMGLLTKENIIRDMRENNKALIKGKYSIDVWTDHVLDLYSRLGALT